MSRILRRPMFRGGRVSSYGTGIASGLADGGMPPKRGLVTGPGGYGGWEDRGTGYGGTGNMVLGSDLMNFVKQNPKYGSLDFANTLNPKQYYNKPAPYPGTDIWQIGRGGPKIENSPEFLKLYQNFMDPETTLIDPDEVDIETGEITGSVTGKSGVDADDVALAAKNKTTSQGRIPENLSSDTGADDVPAGVIIDEGEVVLTGGEDPGIEEMADKYFALMGGDKATGRDLADMALLASSKLLKEGATVRSGLSEFMEAEAAKGPGRAETIRKDATKMAITQDIQMDFLQKKLDSAESIADKNIIAQQMRDLRKTYAPGITQKDIEYGTNLEKGSEEHTLWLINKKLSPTLASEAKSRATDPTNLAGAMTVAEINAFGPVYYIDWQGIFTPKTSKADGTYLDVQEKKIIKFKGGELISKEDIELQ